MPQFPLPIDFALLLEGMEERATGPVVLLAIQQPPMPIDVDGAAEPDCAEETRCPCACQEPRSSAATLLGHGAFGHRTVWFLRENPYGMTK